MVGRDSEIVNYVSQWLQFYTNQNGVGYVMMFVKRGWTIYSHKKHASIRAKWLLRKKTPGDFGDMQYQHVPATKWFQHILNFRGRNVKDILQ